MGLYLAPAPTRSQMNATRQYYNDINYNVEQVTRWLAGEIDSEELHDNIRIDKGENNNG